MSVDPMRERITAALTRAEMRGTYPAAIAALRELAALDTRDVLAGAGLEVIETGVRQWGVRHVSGQVFEMDSEAKARAYPDSLWVLVCRLPGRDWETVAT